MNIALNIIWLVFGGLILALGYGLAAVVMEAQPPTLDERRGLDLPTFSGAPPDRSVS